MGGALLPPLLLGLFGLIIVVLILSNSIYDKRTDFGEGIVLLTVPPPKKKKDKKKRCERGGIP